VSSQAIHQITLTVLEKTFFISFTRATPFTHNPSENTNTCFKSSAISSFAKFEATFSVSSI